MGALDLSPKFWVIVFRARGTLSRLVSETKQFRKPWLKDPSEQWLMRKRKGFENRCSIYERDEGAVFQQGDVVIREGSGEESGCDRAEVQSYPHQEKRKGNGSSDNKREVTSVYTMKG